MVRCAVCQLKAKEMNKYLQYDNNEGSPAPPQRIMKCSRITLFDRGRKEKLTKEPKHACRYQQDFNPQHNNYMSWLNKGHSLHDGEQRYLTVHNLVLPSNAQVLVNTGALSERWVNKAPRLQSAKCKTPKVPTPTDQEESDTQDEEEPKPTTSIENDIETDSQLMELQEVMQEYEIDENVQRLIQEAAEYDKRMAEEKNVEEANKRTHRKTSKNKTKEYGNETKEKSRSKLTRTVTVSLSRPASPETVQVIRVDVTSNYSIEEPQEAEDKEDGAAQESGEEEENDERRKKKDRVRNRLFMRKSLIKSCSSRELALQCQKLALIERKSTITNYNNTNF